MQVSWQNPSVSSSSKWKQTDTTNTSREENSELRVNINAYMKYFYKGVKSIHLTAVSNIQNIKTQQSCNLKNKVAEAEKMGQLSRITFVTI